MCGPKKEKSRKKVSMPKPTTASRLLMNSRSASRHPLCIAPSSTASATWTTRCASSGMGGIDMAASFFFYPGRSGQPDARVGDGQRQVRDQVSDDDNDGAPQRVGEYYPNIDLH